jgi:hypothetical protein
MLRYRKCVLRNQLEMVRSKRVTFRRAAFGT